MTPDQEFEFYARPESQVPQGPPIRRHAPTPDPISVRPQPELPEQLRTTTAGDDELSP